MFRLFIAAEPKKKKSQTKSQNNEGAFRTFKCKNCGIWFLNRTGVCPTCGGKGKVKDYS